MRIPISWIRNFVDIDRSPEEVGEALTMLGLEVEGYEPWGDGDTILDISITPNRGDCLSVKGIARELSAYYALPLRETPLFKGEGAKHPPNIKVLNTKGCPRYIGWTFEIDINKKTPDIIAYRLDACGLRSVNIVVDITNYVLIEMGQPLHAFDLDKLSGERIIVRNAEMGESIVLIDGREVSLSNEDLVIADSEKPVAIAGIMGGIETEVSPETKRVLLESATFNYRSIRLTSKRQRIVSPSSHRFERMVGYSSPDIGARRALKLLLENDAIRDISKPLDTGKGHKKQQINVNLSDISALIGQEPEYDEIFKKMNYLGLETITSGDNAIITIPDYRPDLKRKADIVEEVVRLMGYENIESTMPEGPFKPPEHEELFNFGNRLREILNRMGLSETLTLSFTGERRLTSLGIKPSETKNLIKVKNPVSEDMAYLRDSLLPSLIEAVVYNHRRNIDSVSLYEIANVYYREKGEKIEEAKLGIVLYGRATPRNWLTTDEKYTIYHLKGMIEVLLNDLNISEYNFYESSHILMEGGSCLAIKLNDTTIGHIGKLKETITNTFKVGDAIYISEISVQPLIEKEKKTRMYVPPSPFPAVFRDLSILARNTIKAGDIINTIIKASNRLIKDITLYDVYEGREVPDGCRSLTFSMVFQSEEKTLTDNEINEIFNKIVRELKEKYDITLRG